MSSQVSSGQTLHEVFGYSEFRPQQGEIVEALIAGQDAFVLMPTGGGKSLCYQIPALHRDGVAIVVSPLISLMKDQVDALVANGVRAAFYNSSLKAEESRQVLSCMPESLICFTWPRSACSVTVSSIGSEV